MKKCEKEMNANIRKRKDDIKVVVNFEKGSNTTLQNSSVRRVLYTNVCQDIIRLGTVLKMLIFDQKHIFLQSSILTPFLVQLKKNSLAEHITYNHIDTDNNLGLVRSCFMLATSWWYCLSFNYSLIQGSIFRLMFSNLEMFSKPFGYDFSTVAIDAVKRAFSLLSNLGLQDSTICRALVT